MSGSHYTQSTTTEYNGGSRIITADESALIYAGTLPGEQTVASLTPTLLTLAAGLEVIGGQIKVGPEQITLSVGPPPAAASITLEPGTLTLKAGEATITLNAIEGITLTFPGATVQLGLGGKIAINALMMNTTATNYELTATALTESVAGSAERTAAAAMFT
jgi:hypothetical protein